MGEIIWKYESQKTLNTKLTVFNDQILALYIDEIKSISLIDGSLIWSEIFEDRKLADITWQVKDSKNKSIIKITAKPYLPYKYNFINVIVFNIYVKYVLQSYLNSVVKGLKYHLESNKTVLQNQFGRHIWYS